MFTSKTIPLGCIELQNPWTDRLLAVYFSSFLGSTFICNFNAILTSIGSKSQEQHSICTDSSLTFTRFLSSQSPWQGNFSLFLPLTFILLFIDFFTKTLSFSCLDFQPKYPQNQNILPKSYRIWYLLFWQLYKSEVNLLKSIVCNYYRDQKHFHSLRHDATQLFKFAVYTTQSYAWFSCCVSLSFSLIESYILDLS